MAYRDRPDGDDLGAGSTGTLPAGDCWPTAGQWPVPDRQPVPGGRAPSVPDLPPAGTHWPAGGDYWPGSEASWRPGDAALAEDGTLRDCDAPYDYEDGRA
jgi:hypothetical protein